MVKTGRRWLAIAAESGRMVSEMQKQSRSTLALNASRAVWLLFASSLAGCSRTGFDEPFADSHTGSYIIFGLFCAAFAGVILTLSALLRLRSRHFTESERILWALIILFFPVAGAVAFFLVRPRERLRAPSAVRIFRGKLR